MPFSFSGHVVGSWVDFSGRPSTGYIVLEAPLSLSSYYDNESNAGMVGRLIPIPLENGKIDRFVPATDDPDIEPTDWTYKVTYLFNGAANRSFHIFVPSGVVTDIPTAVHQSVSGVPLGSSIFHSALTGRTAADQHPIGAITGLQAALDALAGDPGGLSVVDNLDGTLILDGDAIVDNLNGTLMIGA